MTLAATQKRSCADDIAAIRDVKACVCPRSPRTWGKEMTNYATKILTTESEISSATEPWERLRANQPKPHIATHPGWITAELRADGNKVNGGKSNQALVAALYDGSTLVGVAPFFTHDYRWSCRLGYTPIASFPVKRGVLCGDDLLGPADREANEALLRAITEADAGCHILLFEGIPTNSPLWRLLHESTYVREHFWTYVPSGPAPNWRIDLPGSFDAYLSKWSGSTRRTLQYKVRRMEKACRGALRVERITERAQLPSFLAQAERISKQSWQGRQLGQIICASEHGPKLEVCANRGWLRSYVLLNGDEPISFVLGYQESGIFYHDQCGYDPVWAAHHPGTTLLYRLIEDLFAWNRPEILDFGLGDNQYKQVFGNSVRDTADVYLLRKGVYMGFVGLLHHTCMRTGSVVRAGLDRLQLREKVRHMLRGRPKPAPIAPTEQEPALTVQKPAAQKPAPTPKPAPQKSTAQKPAPTQKPAAQKSAAQKPAAQKPAAQKPAATPSV